MAEGGENGGAPGVDTGEGGEGAPGTGAPDGLYDKYLEGAPPETQELLRGVLHKFNSETVAPKMREHAEFRQKFEPLQGIEGLSDIPAENLQELIGWAQSIQSPEQFQEWYATAAKEMADQDPEGFEGLWQQIGDELGYFEDDGEGEGGETDPQLEALESQISQLTETVNGFLGQQEHSSRQEQIDAALDSELGELSTAHNNGEPFDQEFEQSLYRMAIAFEGEEQPLHRAFDEIQKLRGDAQSKLVESKLKQPAPANGNGRADTAPEQFHSLEDTKQAALARLHAA